MIVLRDLKAYRVNPLMLKELRERMRGARAFVFQPAGLQVEAVQERLPGVGDRDQQRPDGLAEALHLQVGPGNHPRLDVADARDRRQARSHAVGRALGRHEGLGEAVVPVEALLRVLQRLARAQVHHEHRHAARHHGVRAHGVTLSQTQYDWTCQKIAEEGLGDRVTVELQDYRELTGPYDKIASIGMYEHVGIQNYPTYFGHLYRLLADRGLLLNHGITRGAKKSARRFNRIRPENRLIRKYIFPGSELDHIGHTLSVMESQRFQIHDVEGWREHYAQTTRLWYQALIEHEREARAEVGDEKYRMWIAYLAGVSLSFQDGSLRIFQTLASKHKAKGPSGLPPTRADLYRD